MFNDLWCEEYRPKTLDDIILTEENRVFLLDLKNKGSIPRLLFSGPPGIGKTSLAKIIVGDILDCQYLYINASDENGIDTIRSKVFGFAQTMSFDGKIKVVILDECDGLTFDAQKILRNLMEDYSSTTRFILTCNYPYKIIPALHSRCQEMDLTPPYEECIKKAVEILKKENIKVDDENKKKLCNLISTFYPDLRRIINMLQKNTTGGILNIKDVNDNIEFAREVFTKIMEKEHYAKIRKYVIENEINFSNDYLRLLRTIHDVAFQSASLDFNKKRKVLGCLGIAMMNHQPVMDKEINFFTTILELSEIIEE